MRFIFPYGIRYRGNGYIEVFPAAELSMIGRSGKGIRALLHIDSGATTSILPASDATTLGIELRKGTQMLVRGIGDVSLTGYRHTATIQFNGLTVSVPVIFIEHASVPRILGREGVFPRFAILFDEAKRRIGFLDRRERKVINRILIP